MSDTDQPVVLDGLNGIGRLVLKSGAKRSRVCAECTFSAVEGKDRVCRVDPPKVFLFMVPVVAPSGLGLNGPRQQGMQIISQTAFPVVRNDQWCGKFEPLGT